MSTNINNIDIGSGQLLITKRNVRIALRKYRGELPEIHFLQGLKNRLLHDSPDPIPVDDLCWYGEGSGWAFHVFEEILSHTTGQADVVITWETGGFTGIRINDGKQTRHQVKLTLSSEIING